ncbi:NAD(P)/FAD-dependent oxidoreductase [Antrihabitans sp. YC2-6]|uniref:flavin-containing monooxygenase n=1 Tax=Antrihabitans sp. YC2-6 TaxID=2799498 RepID=UPI0018F60CB8|nr:NAD(P)/FAD-dependent oxidoreductase [Antrihabitans sp. YC2-6]MBJ8346215.1 NAD(P)/FAD-dependent oxidoreductase [Antrihabitans sp. YC2-6]
MSTSVSPDHEVIIVGAGFSGIGLAIKLQENGFTDYLIVDEASGVGGTWHWNTYPGVAVDIPSFSYQFSFEKLPDWTRTYAPGRELKAYAEHCVDKYGLRRRIRFGTTIDAAVYDEDANVWRLTTSEGEELTARYVLNASGALTRPKAPEIPGVENFRGATMHTARWDHTQDLSGKRVGIIGTGASAVQIIPAIADNVDHLTVFQRTPIWCLPKLDLALPGPARWLMGRIPGAQSVTRLLSQTFVELTFPISAHYHGVVPTVSLAEKAVLSYLRSQVKDPVVQEKLTPRYALGCKRPSFHNEYLATFNRDNVYLETDAISHVTENAVHTADGAVHEIDVLILATGFKVMESGSMPTYALRGVGGLLLEEWWDENRLQAFQGVSVPKFPNHFNVMGPYGYNGSSYFALIESQAAHILRCLKRARSQGANYVEVTKEANDAFFAEVLSRRTHQVFWQDSCANANSYYFDKHGDVPLLPTTTIESALRSRRFDLGAYNFEKRVAKVPVG